MGISNRNIVFWAGMTAEAAEVLRELVHEGLIIMLPTSPWTYLIDGRSLRLPVAKRAASHAYKTPHWAPVVFRPPERVPVKIRRHVENLRSRLAE